MLCVRKMLFWWPLNSTIPSDDVEWLPFILRPPLKNSNALGYVIRSMMQWYIFCKMLEEGKAVKPWISIVTVYHTIFTLCIGDIFHLKRTKDFVQESTKSSQYSKQLKGGAWKGAGSCATIDKFCKANLPYDEGEEDKFETRLFRPPAATIQG